MLAPPESGEGNTLYLRYFLLSPPVLGLPVLAIERVPGSLEMGAINSSGMLPPPLRVTTYPVEASRLEHFLHGGYTLHLDSALLTYYFLPDTSDC